MRGWKTPRSLIQPTADKTGSELAALRGHGTGPKWQPGAGGMCLHTIILDPSDPKRIYIAISAAGAFRTDDGGRRGSRSTADCVRNSFPIQLPRSATACTASRCIPNASRRALHAEALGRDAQRRRRRHVARSQRQSADRLRIRRSTCTRTSRRRSTSCRSRATRSTIRRTASCACTAAAAAGTSGKR